MLLLISCGPRAAHEIVLASTTSVDDSGLLDTLLPAFERGQPGYRVKLIAVGSGHALTLGRRRDADVLLVHSPADEEMFMRDGHGLSRELVMYNEFLVAGPPSDPAAVSAATNAAEAFRRIAAAEAPFVSRGDDSGTHRAELGLWTSAGIRPQALGWYVDIGQGMADALRIASERDAYLLTDRATFLALAPTVRSHPLFEGDGALHNRYSVILVEGARNAAGAAALARWIVSPDAQSLIGSFGTERFGRPLFMPAR